MKFPLIGDAYPVASKSIGVQKCINLYPEVTDKGKTPIALIGTPGTKYYLSLGTGSVRNMKVVGKELFAVIGYKVYKVTKSTTFTEIGSLNSSTGYVSIAGGITQVIFSDETNDESFIHTIGTTTITKITDVNFSSARGMLHQDGYFIYFRKDSDQVYNSTLDDGSTWSALDVFSTIAEIDNINAIESLHNEIWIFGDSNSTEVWYNAGNATGSPFSKNQSVRIDKGCAAKRSVVKADNTIFWITADSTGAGQLVKANNYIPEIVSNPAIEYEWSTYNRIDDAFAYVYKHEGHEFYIVTFPSANKTWAYDLSNGAWHERQTHTTGRQRYSCYAYFDNKHLVGDYSVGYIFELDGNTYTEFLALLPIERIKTCKILYDPDNKNEKGKGMYSSFIIDALQIDFEEGVGIDGAGQGDDPQVMLRYSKNEGNTWSNELWRSLGKIGEYGKRAIWRRLGRFRDCTIEITITDPVKVVITGAEVKTRQLDN